MGIEWKEYKGKRVLYVDYHGCQSEQDLINLLEDQIRALNAATTKVLVLNNYEGVSLSTAYMDRAKQAGKALGLKIQKNAAVGITGLKTILFQGYLAFTGDKNTKAFANDAQALEWLVQ